MNRNRIRIVVIVLGVVVLITMGVITAIARESEGSCSSAPAPYREISNLIATDEEGYLFVLYGIANGEESTIDGKQKIVIPPCWSNERSFITVANKFVTTTDGQRLFILTGVIARQLAAEQPTPLPTNP